MAPPSPERPSYEARKSNRSTRIIKVRDDQTEEDDDSEDEAGIGTNDKAYEFNLTGSQQQGTIVILISVRSSLSIPSVVLVQWETPASRSRPTYARRPSDVYESNNQRSKADNKSPKGNLCDVCK